MGMESLDIWPFCKLSHPTISKFNLKIIVIQG
jgi:hypothetical protein